MKMRLRILSVAFVVLTLASSFGAEARAQSNERIAGTWGGPSSPLFKNILRERGTWKRSATLDPSGIKFTPSGDSGVAKALADAFGRDAVEKAALVNAFLQLKQAYEVEVAKDGKSNNLAAALTFFIAANVTAYGQADAPSDKATDALFEELQGYIASVPELARMSNAEKQKMHDWLVCMGGFTLASYLEAKQSGDKEGLSTSRDLADYSMRLVLGVEAGKLSFKGDALSVEQEQAATARAASNEGAKIVGVWSKSASSPWGSSSGAVATNAGYYKGQYQFKADGTYSFKGESWGGYSRAEEFWTIEESGTYSVEGDSLTVSASKSTATLRNSAGAVKQSKNNQLEKVTYGWSLHYFEGIGETNLVLRPARQTTRDGGFSSNSDFPNSYLYSRDGNIEWRF